MQAISKTKGDLNCIANNMEKYISFAIGQRRFINSLQFLNALLDKLVESNDKESLTIVKEYEQNLEKCELLFKMEFIPTNTWTTLNVSKKRGFLKKPRFIVDSRVKGLLTNNISTLKTFITSLNTNK